MYGVSLRNIDRVLSCQQKGDDGIRIWCVPNMCAFVSGINHAIKSNPLETRSAFTY